jgi:hypothetical protein
VALVGLPELFRDRRRIPDADLRRRAAAADPLPAAGPAFEQIPVPPHEISYTVHLASPASKAEIDELFEAVERTCPILNLLRHPQTVRATVQHTQTARAQSQTINAVAA